MSQMKKSFGFILDMGDKNTLNNEKNLGKVLRLPTIFG